MKPTANPWSIGSPPALVRLTWFAQRLGVDPDTVERASRDGRMPMEILRLGPVRYLRHADAQRILAQLETPSHG